MDNEQNKKDITERTIAASKNLILQAQKGFDVEEIVNGIMTGSLKVMTAQDISGKLRIPEDTLHKWVENGDKNYRIPEYSSAFGLVNALRKYEQASKLNEIDNKTIFPKPDFYLGRHPRWLESTLRNWLLSQIKKAD